MLFLKEPIASGWLRETSATPRTAEETMCVIGDSDVIFIEAIDIRRPRVPVMNDPTQNALAWRFTTSFPSSTNKTTGTRRKELTTFMYHDKTIALPLRPTSKLFFFL